MAPEPLAGSCDPGGRCWVWAEAWEVGPELRAVRHRVANLLVPVLVAAELLDADGPDAEMLTDGVGVLRRHLDRIGELLRLPAPALTPWTVTGLADVLELDVAGVRDSDHVLADAPGLAERVCDELAQDGRGTLSAYCDNLDGPGWSGRALVIRSRIDTDPLGAEALRLAAVPLSSARAGVGLALASAEARRHGGGLRGCTAEPVVEVVIPLVASRSPST